MTIGIRFMPYGCIGAIGLFGTSIGRHVGIGRLLTRGLTGGDDTATGGVERFEIFVSGRASGGVGRSAGSKFLLESSPFL